MHWLAVDCSNAALLWVGHTKNLSKFTSFIWIKIHSKEAGEEQGVRPDQMSSELRDLKISNRRIKFWGKKDYLRLKMKWNKANLVCQALRLSVCMCVSVHVRRTAIKTGAGVWLRKLDSESILKAHNWPWAPRSKAVAVQLQPDSTSLFISATQRGKKGRRESQMEWMWLSCSL